MRFLGRRTTWFFGALSAGIGLSLFFTNCQKQNDHLDSSSQSSTTVTTAASSSAINQLSKDPFADEKVQISLPVTNTPGFQQKLAARDRIPAGTRLIAIASNECMADRGQELSQQIYNYDQEFANLDQQAYTWIPDQDLSLSDIKDLAAKDPCVKGIASDGILTATSLPNDPLISSESQFTSIGGVDTYGFYDDATHGSRSNVIVAVIDSGVDQNHPDLQNQLWHDGSGIFGYNYISPGSQPVDDYGHGTNVAGLIAAQSNNDVGIAGVMGHDIQLMILKVQNSSGTGYISDIASAIDFARANGANVINISMVGYGSNAGLLSSLQAAAAANVFIAVAAGNDSITIDTSSAQTYAVPAAYGVSIAGMMTVGSVDAITNAKSSFSNVSPTYVEIAAPGSNGIYFTTMTNGYTTGQGTSYSSPQVAGAAALTMSFLKKNQITYTAADVENILATSSYPASGLTSYFTNGRLLDLRGLKAYLQGTYLGPETGGFDDF